tara:strand:- start:297 stop:3170 length:2874 start_codon:yes stop_codon:yes gene_type:complete
MFQFTKESLSTYLDEGIDGIEDEIVEGLSDLNVPDAKINEQVDVELENAEKELASNRERASEAADIIIERAMETATSVTGELEDHPSDLFIIANERAEVNPKLILLGGQKGLNANAMKTAIKELAPQVDDIPDFGRNVKQQVLEKLNALWESSDYGALQAPLLGGTSKPTKTPIGMEEGVKVPRTSYRKFFNKFTIDGKSLKGKNIAYLGAVGKLDNQRLKVTETLSPQEAEELSDTIQEYANDWNEQALLRPLVDKLGSLFDEDTVTIFDIPIDDFVNSLDLRDVSRRKSIYKYWKDISRKKNEFNASIARLDTALNAYDGVEGIPDEMKSIIDRKPDLNKIRGDSGSYIVEINTQEAGIKEALTVKQLENVDLTAIRLLLDLLATREEAEQIDNDAQDNAMVAYQRWTGEGTQGQTDAEIEESSSRGRISESELDAIDAKMVKNFVDIQVDPLMKYALDKPGNEILSVSSPTFEKEMREVKNAMLMYAKMGDIILIDEDNVMNEVEQMANKLEREAAIGDTVVHLPYTEHIRDLFFTRVGGRNPKAKSYRTSVAGDFDKYEDHEKVILEFLQWMRLFVDYAESTPEGTGQSSMEQEAQPRVTTPSPASSSKPVGLMYGRAASRRKNPRVPIAALDKNWKKASPNRKATNASEQLVTAFNDAFKKTLEYYIAPCFSRMIPFDNQPKWSMGAAATSLGKNGDENSMLTIMLTREKEVGMNTLDDLEDFEVIIRALRRVNNPKNTANIDTLKTYWETVVEKVTEILGGGSDVKRNAIVEIGHALHETIKRNKVDTMHTFFGRPTRELYEEFESSPNESYPFQLLINHLLRLNSMYEDRDTMETMTTDDRGQSQKEVVRQFMDVYRSLDILKNDIELTVLEGHDIIRKMNDKPVYYNVAKSDDLDHVGGALEILKKKYNTELTPFELDSLVHETNSFVNLSEKYGISQDAVYFVKGNFR